MAIGSPALIGSPSVMWSSESVPALCAVISFHLHRPMMQSSWPSSTMAVSYRWTRDLTLGNAVLAIGPA